MTNPVSLVAFMTLTVADISVWIHNITVAAQFIS